MIINLFRLILLISFFPVCFFSQDTIAKDLDFDGRIDSIYFNRQDSVIICRLSSQNFSQIKSNKIGDFNFMSGIRPARNGFEFFINWMRAGNANQFRYNKKTQKIQLIGMTRYEFGNGDDDGTGESSLNLISSNYKGNWSFHDYLANNEEGETIKIPTIKTKMKLKTINLEDFGEKIYFDYATSCAKLFHKEKDKILRERGRNLND